MPLMSELVFIILAKPLANKILVDAQNIGISGGVIVPAEGSLPHSILARLGISRQRREVMVLSTRQDLAHQLLQHLLDHYHFDKPGSGIAFSIPIYSWRDLQEDVHHEEKPEALSDYECLFLIVDRNDGRRGVQLANEIGVQGATLIHGRGTAPVHEDLGIEPQKDIVLFLVKRPQLAQVRDHLTQHLDLAEEGAGIVFSLPVSQVTGLSPVHLKEVASA